MNFQTRLLGTGEGVAKLRCQALLWLDRADSGSVATREVLYFGQRGVISFDPESAMLNSRSNVVGFVVFRGTSNDVDVRSTVQDVTEADLVRCVSCTTNDTLPINSAQPPDTAFISI
ncbi:hypothetical protein MHYP_G00164810 [Metynnis hypsauchen]